MKFKYNNALVIAGYSLELVSELKDLHKELQLKNEPFKTATGSKYDLSIVQEKYGILTIEGITDAPIVDDITTLAKNYPQLEFEYFFDNNVESNKPTDGDFQAGIYSYELGVAIYEEEIENADENDVELLFNQY